MISEPIRFLNLKIFVAKLLTSDFIGKLIGIVFMDSIRSHGLFVDTQLASPRIKSSIFFGIYEGTEIRFIRQYLILSNDIDVIELGSSLGVLSSHIAKQIRKECRLVCVEANPYLLPAISSNLQRNASHLSSYEVISAAIDYREKDNVDFFISEDSTTSCSLKTSTENITVKSITLGQIIESFSINKYVLIMDIEGSEIDLLINDKKSLEQCEMIIAELHEGTSLTESKFMSVDSMINLMVSYGFRLQRRRGSVCLFVK
jgi:FkbM family methyltransferase